MKYFIDFEFINIPFENKVLPISMGMISENNDELYLEFKVTEEYKNKADEFVRKIIFPMLSKQSYEKYSFKDKNILTCEPIDKCYAREQILKFLLKCENKDIKLSIKEQLKDVEFIGLECGFDYVLISQLFGLFNDWEFSFYIMYDVKQRLNDLNIKMDDKLFENLNLNYFDFKEHHALDDAKLIKILYENYC